KKSIVESHIAAAVANPTSLIRTAGLALHPLRSSSSTIRTRIDLEPLSLQFNLSGASSLGNMSPPPFVSTLKSHINVVVHRLKSL
ncbi:hypothetical protein HID58_034290, partial [Brassica napus]